MSDYHRDTTLGYAQRLATFLWEKHYKKDAPEWKPLPDLIGVLTQIDNMTAGLVRTQQGGQSMDEAAADNFGLTVDDLDEDEHD